MHIVLSMYVAAVPWIMITRTWLPVTFLSEGMKGRKKHMSLDYKDQNCLTISKCEELDQQWDGSPSFGGKLASLHGHLVTSNSHKVLTSVLVVFNI